MERSLGKEDSGASAVPGSPATIEPATWRDVGALRHLEQTCFPKDAWPLFDLMGVLTFPNTLRLKAVVDGQLVGFPAWMSSGPRTWRRSPRSVCCRSTGDEGSLR